MYRIKSILRMHIWVERVIQPSYLEIIVPLSCRLCLFNVLKGAGGLLESNNQLYLYFMDLGEP